MTNKIAGSPRPKGGQPANRNALKHGFYSHFFTQGELSAISSIDPSTLKDEITLIRIISRRILDLLSSASPEDFSVFSDLLIRSTSAIASLSRTQSVLSKMDGVNPLSDLYSILEDFESKSSSAPAPIIKKKSRV